MVITGYSSLCHDGFIGTKGSPPPLWCKGTLALDLSGGRSIDNYDSSMSGFPAPGPWPNIRKDLEKPNRRAVVAVVAYIGVDAPSVMPLKRGDILVCDASPLSIKSNRTSADALAKYHRRGVTVFSMSGLHAKVIATSTWAWVGSANASENSEKNLEEAAVRITKDAAKRMLKWAQGLASEDRELELTDIRELQKIPRDKIQSGPRKETRPHDLPNTLSKLTFVETGGDLTAKEKTTISEDKSAARSDAKAVGAPSAIYAIWFYGQTKVKKGDWIVDIRNGHVRAPAQIVRIAKRGNDSIVWLCPIKVSSRPTVKVLRGAVPALMPDFEEHTINSASLLKRILSLFK